MKAISVLTAAGLALAWSAAGFAGLLDLTPPGFSSSNGFGINDAGIVAGDGNWQQGPGQPWIQIGFSSDGTDANTALWWAGGYQRHLTGINNQGAAVGYATTTSTGAIDSVYMSGGILGAGRVYFQIAGDATQVTGINDSNTIVGRYFDGTTYHGFLTNLSSAPNNTYLTPNTAVNYTQVDVSIPGVAVTGTAVLDINDTGEYVGAYETPASGSNMIGFFYNGTSYQSIQVPGAASTIVYGINNAGQMVGSYSIYNATWGVALPHGFITSDGVHFETVDVAGAVATQLEGINNTGFVSGTYYTGTSVDNSMSHAFELTPEPASVLMAGVGLAVLALVRRRRSAVR
jgi:hypothetical protein